MFVLVLVATVVIGFTLKWLAQSMSLFSVATAKHYSIILSVISSLYMRLGIKGRVLLYTLFSGLWGHKRYNALKIMKIIIYDTCRGAKLLIFTKSLITLVKLPYVFRVYGLSKRDE